ncbi:hypothetical protein B0H34DRAFT_782167 [Crassisporium funariophilum]|nr:hypothetical protein B0H34DRAFT_782167 [Crassisporium funariophilum]
MEGYQARLDSFKKTKRIKNPTKSSSTTTLKWPHPYDFRANPETLAEAGFYYDPSYDDPDNVTCYVCEKALGGWEEDDDPILIHWTKCGQTCCWANVRCGLKFDMDQEGRFTFPVKTRAPTHKLMEKARYETYNVGKGWIHDKEKNHGANSKMMARAGFVFSPQYSGDDLVTCLYCNTSLSGWEAEDDPMEEHRKRDHKSDSPCPFFSSSFPESTAADIPASRAQSAKPPAKSQYKPASKSTSKSKYQDVLVPTKTHDGDPDADSDTSINTTKAATKTPRKGRSTSESSARKSSAKTPKSKTRSSSRSGLKNVAEVEEDETEDGPLEPPPTVKKKARSRSKSVARSEAPEQTELEDNVPRKTSRSKSKTKAAEETEEEAPRKPSRSKSKASVAPSADDNDTSRKPSRTRSKAKVADSEQEEELRNTVKPKAGARTASRSKSKPLPTPSDLESDPELKALTIAPKKKTVPKPKPQAPAVEDLFNDDVLMKNDIIPPPSPPPTHEHSAPRELAPLFVPKRTTVAKPATPLGDSEDLHPIEKEKKKPGRPKAKPKPTPAIALQEDELAHEVLREQSETSRPAEIQGPLAPVSNNPPSQISMKDKSAAKLKPSSKRAEEIARQQMKVVEISSDEEIEDDIDLEKDKKSKTGSAHSGKENDHGQAKVAQQAQPLTEPEARPPSSRSKAGKPPIIVDKVHFLEQTRPPVPITIPLVDGDVSMEYDEPRESQNHILEAPSTPPRSVIQLPQSEKVSEHPAAPNTPPKPVPVALEPLMMPALSKLPFTPLHALSEAELDMTVEEWIRYQMDAEHDKFRRDGERELQRFRSRAEEVRNIIEGL